MTRDVMLLVEEIRSLMTDEYQEIERVDLCEMVGVDRRTNNKMRQALAYLEGSGEIVVRHHGRGNVRVVVEFWPTGYIPFLGDFGRLTPLASYRGVGIRTYTNREYNDTSE